MHTDFYLFLFCVDLSIPKLKTKRFLEWFGYIYAEMQYVPHDLLRSYFHSKSGTIFFNAALP